MIIELKHISKKFGSIKVLEDCSIKIKSGQIHGLMGENGAGKSTLMNIATGNLNYDLGTIIIDDKIYEKKDLKRNNLIAFIHQEISVFNHLTILENLFIGDEMVKYKYIIDKKSMEEKAYKIFKQLNFNISLSTLVEKCSMAQKQLIAIARSLITNKKIIIMDEPTASLNTDESENLLKIIIKMKKDGVGFVYISHRLEEMKKICDEITILRDGKTVFTKPMKNISINEIVKAMVGREINDFYPKKIKTKDETICEVKNISLKNKFNNISFQVKNGEIFGIYGLVGSGRTEVIKTIFGLNKQKFDGEILINSKKIKFKHPQHAIDNGVSLVSKERKTTGLLLESSIRDNIVLPNLRLISNHNLLKEKGIDNYVTKLVKKLKVKTNSNNTLTKNLSGGNQQKVVLAKWLGVAPFVMILDEPTRGVDVGSKQEIYKIISELSQSNVAIILVSSELPEVIGLSHRIMIMKKGLQLKILSNYPTMTTQENIMNIITKGEV